MEFNIIVSLIHSSITTYYSFLSSLPPLPPFPDFCKWFRRSFQMWLCLLDGWYYTFTAFFRNHSVILVGHSDCNIKVVPIYSLATLHICTIFHDNTPNSCQYIFIKTSKCQHHDGARKEITKDSRIHPYRDHTMLFLQPMFFSRVWAFKHLKCYIVSYRCPMLLQFSLTPTPTPWCRTCMIWSKMSHKG